MVISSLTLFDGATFAEIPSQCRVCGALLRRHDQKKKRFATLIEEGEIRPIVVYVVRYRCRGCERLWYADEPFYPGTRHGVLVVDLATLIATRYPFHHTARILSGIGVQIDRGTVRNYARFPKTDFTDMYGIPVPNRIVTLSGLVAEGRSIEGAELFAALGLPSTNRTLLHGFPPEK